MAAAMASKMARPVLPHRINPARGLHGGTSSGVGRSSPNPSRFSTSGGSSATSNEDLAARNQEVLRQGGNYWLDPELMAHFKATTNTCLTVLVFGAGLFYTFVKPKLNRLEDRADSLSREVFKLKQELIKVQNIKDEGQKAKIYEAQSMETSGPHDKGPG